MEDTRFVRYLDAHRREADGRWRFAKRVVTYDHISVRTTGVEVGPVVEPGADPSYATLASRLFTRGPRA